MGCVPHILICILTGASVCSPGKWNQEAVYPISSLPASQDLTGGMGLAMLILCPYLTHLQLSLCPHRRHTET